MIFNMVGGGGKGGTLTVSAPANVTVTVSNSKKSYTKKSGSTGVVEFKGLDGGTWTVTISNGTDTATKQVTITTDYSTNITFFTATISVSYIGGYVCKCSKGSTVFTAPDKSGSAKFTVEESGTWTVSVEYPGGTVTKTVSVTTSGQSESVVVGEIYNAGTQYFPLTTSGYTKSGAAQWGNYSDYATRGSATFNNTNIALSLSEIQGGPGAIRFFGTSDALDVSAFSTLHIDMSSHTHGAQAYLYLAATPTKVCPGKNSGGSYVEIASGKTSATIDVSSLSSVYVVVTATAYDSTANPVSATITKIWAD